MPSIRRPAEEARGKKRITKVLPVDCKVVAFPLNSSATSLLRSGDSFGGRTINMSKTGLQVHTDFALDPKTVLDLTVQLDRPARKLTVRSEVAWCRRNAADLYGRWGMGLRIVESRPGDLDLLNAYYDSLS